METPSEALPAREMERMMKLQDVILKALAKKLSLIEAAEIAGMSVRNMQRLRQRYLDDGYNGCSTSGVASAATIGWHWR